MADEMEAGRALDELIAVRVMGFACVHQRERVPAEVVAVRIARDWKEQYGTECPPEYALATAAYEQYEADYPECWCAKCHERMNGGVAGWSVSKYSTDLVAAWEVVEKLAERGLWIDLTDMRHGCYRNDDVTSFVGWRAEISDIDHDDEHGPVPICHEYTDEPWSADAATAPLAICRAALKAIATPPASESSPVKEELK